MNFATRGEIAEKDLLELKPIDEENVFPDDCALAEWQKAELLEGRHKHDLQAEKYAGLSTSGKQFLNSFIYKNYTKSTSQHTEDKILYEYALKSRLDDINSGKIKAKLSEIENIKSELKISKSNKKASDMWLSSLPKIAGAFDSIDANP